jgi:hypothetical protein
MLCVFFSALFVRADEEEGLPVERLRGCKWIEGLPKGIEGKLEITPQIFCDRLFFLRVTVTNKTGKPVDMLDTIAYKDRETGYHIDVQSKELPWRDKRNLTFIASEESGVILKPHRASWNPSQPCFATLNNGESRILFLGPIMLGGLNEDFCEKFNASNPKLRFAFLSKEENLSGSMSIPIRFKIKNKLLDKLMNEGEKILLNITDEMDKKNEPREKINQIARLDPKYACLYLPIGEREKFIERYPPGHTKSSLYGILLWRQYWESGDKEKLNEIIRFYWTYHEIVRQNTSLALFLDNQSREKKSMLENEELFETFFQNIPDDYTVFYNGDKNIIYDKCHNEKKLTADEIKKRVKEIMSKPIPSYAGVGNVYLGFMLPFQDWSVSKDPVRFIHVFEGQAVFEDKSYNEISTPIKNLTKPEQKYIQDLIDIIKTGIMPALKK